MRARSVAPPGFGNVLSIRMDTLLDVLGSFIDWGPTGLIGRHWVKKYRRGERMFVRGTVSGLSGGSRWATYVVAYDGRLWVSNSKGKSTDLHPLPLPVPGAAIEECKGRFKGKGFHYRYTSDSGVIEVHPGAPASVYLIEAALRDMTTGRPA
jgi:hypothetical protein